jgi:DNA modification methylase
MSTEKNTLWYGDNLEVMRKHIKDESVDLIYLDPPFNSKANYNILYKEHSGKKSQAQIQAFTDTWTWDDKTQENYQYIIDHSEPAVVQLITSLYNMLGKNDMCAYLVMMTVRLDKMYSILKPTGSIYIHCDSTASHYLRIIMDSIFGMNNFRNEIVWKRTFAHNDPGRFGKNSDRILFYTKTNNYTFNTVFNEYDESYVKNFFKNSDDMGAYRLVVLTGPHINPNDPTWKGYNPSQSGRSWSVPRRIVNQLVGEEKAKKMSIVERLDLLDKNGYIVFSKNGIPSFKSYLDSLEGTPVQEIWTDINPISSQAKERLGYPTQKPLALLRRIIKASSNEGDVVLDPFCGCGTTVDAAQYEKRKWIGIDITYLSINIIERRLRENYPQLNIDIKGVPNDLESARHLAEEHKDEFENWVLSKIGARSRRPDKGVDGVIYISSEKGKTETVVVQVKGGAINTGMIRDFAHTITKEPAYAGIFVTLVEPTTGMRTEATNLGFANEPSETSYSLGTDEPIPKFQIITLEELMNGKQPRLPYRNVTLNR